MSTRTALLTAEEFHALPDKPGVRRELHHGEVFELTYPNQRHWDIQQNVAELLTPKLKEHGYIGGTEFWFRPSPEYQVWAADVAYVSRQRLASVAPDDNLIGAPDLVIEVESKSNTDAEFEERLTICMANGCREFWIVYPKLQRVKTFIGANVVSRYEIGDRIRLAVARVDVDVASIFREK